MTENYPADQLNKLGELHKQGVLSETEFAAAKAKVLSSDGTQSATGTAGRPVTAKKKIRRGRLVALVVLLVVIAAIAGSSGSGGSGSSVGGSDGNAPTHFKVSNKNVAALVTNVINNNMDSPGLAHSPSVSCRPNASTCNIDYTLKEPAGISAGLELIVPTAQVWKGLFKDPRFHSAVMTVSGPLVSEGGKSSTGAMFMLSCNRSDNSQIDWDHVDAHGIQNICTFVQLIKSL